jgi:hypothetical protein
MSAGLRVGFEDKKTKKPYWMRTGDIEDEIQVVEIDYEGERVRLRKGDEEEWLTMETADSVASAATTPALTPQAIVRRRPAVSRPRRLPAEFRGLTKAQYQKTKRLRAPPTPARHVVHGGNPAALARMTKEQREQYYRKYNMDLIRAGGKKGLPLPIQLTPEEDAKLVNEGVLPP